MVQQRGFPLPAALPLCRASTDPLPQMRPAVAEHLLKSSLSAPKRLEQAKDTQALDVHTLLESLPVGEIVDAFQADFARPFLLPLGHSHQPAPKAVTWVVRPNDVVDPAVFAKGPALAFQDAVCWEVALNSTCPNGEAAEAVMCEARAAPPPTVLGQLDSSRLKQQQVAGPRPAVEVHNEPNQTEADVHYVKGKGKDKDCTSRSARKGAGKGKVNGKGKGKGKGKGGEGTDTEKGSAMCEKPVSSLPAPAVPSVPIAETMLPGSPGASARILTDMELLQPGIVVRTGAGCTHAHWAVDARKLKGKDCQAVSPAFTVDLPGQGQTLFKIMLNAKVGSKKGAGFREVKGLGHVVLKCEQQLSPSCADIAFRVGVGRQHLMQPFRGPIERDFYEHSCNGLRSDETEWDFAASVDSNETFVVTLEVASKAAFQADANLWWADLDRP